MLLALPAFTDSLPTDLTLGMTGGASAGADAGLEFWPYEVAMSGGVSAGEDSTIESVGTDIYTMEAGVTAGAATAAGIGEVYEMLGGLAAGSATTREFETPSTYEEGVSGGVSAGADTLVYFDGTVIINVTAGADSTIEFVSPAIHDISADLQPAGGFRWGGEALVAEVIGHIPTGGLVYGGSAIVREAIPFTATGGLVYGGAATVAVVFAHAPTGGFIYSGAATNKTIFIADAPSGGFVWGGSATVSTYSAWHAPSGGFVWGGSALAYAVLADYVATPENPYSQPFFGWTVNAENNAVSRYYRFPATSMCQLAGRTFVTTAAGIYEYGAEDDAGADIRASIQFPKTDFQSTLSKRMEDAYFGLKTTGRMRLKVIVNDDAPRYYPVIPSGDGVKGARADIGKGLKGRYWSARLDNVAGADFDLDSATFLPVRTDHRHGA